MLLHGDSCVIRDCVRNYANCVMRQASIFIYGKVDKKPDVKALFRSEYRSDGLSRVGL